MKDLRVVSDTMRTSRCVSQTDHAASYVFVRPSLSDSLTGGKSYDAIRPLLEQPTARTTTPRESISSSSQQQKVEAFNRAVKTDRVS